MAENTKIEWADHTVNLWWGCSKKAFGVKGAMGDFSEEQLNAASRAYAEKRDPKGWYGEPWGEAGRANHKEAIAAALHAAKHFELVKVVSSFSVQKLRSGKSTYSMLNLYRELLNGSNCGITTEFPEEFIKQFEFITGARLKLNESVTKGLRSFYMAELVHPASDLDDQPMDEDDFEIRI